MSQFLQREDNVETRSIHDGCQAEQWEFNQMVPPINLTSTFKQVSPGKTISPYDYTRHANPTRSVLDTCLASIERAKYALSFPSGCGAMTIVLHLLGSGDHIVCVDDVYGGTARIFLDVGSKMGITTTFVDATDPDSIVSAIKQNTKMIWLESPTNPLLRIVDMKKVSELCHKKNPEIVVVLDNTFLTPYLQRPLEYGVDISVYSLSKFLNGHSDVVMGAICTNDETLYTRLLILQRTLGVIPSSFDCYLVNRSLKTLSLRLDKHMSNALELARYLETEPNVEKVLHPGLPSHPHHKLAVQQSYGHSGIITIFIKGGIEEASKFTTSLKVASLCDSLGGYSTTVVLSAVATRGYVDNSVLDRSAITDNLIRVSVGLEDIKDIIADFKQALRATYGQ